jgi:hypothetical protein
MLCIASPRSVTVVVCQSAIRLAVLTWKEVIVSGAVASIKARRVACQSFVRRSDTFISSSHPASPRCASSGSRSCLQDRPPHHIFRSLSEEQIVRGRRDRECPGRMSIAIVGKLDRASEQKSPPRPEHKSWSSKKRRCVRRRTESLS